jgi:hypothetical protein
VEPSHACSLSNPLPLVTCHHCLWTLFCKTPLM